MSCYYCNNDSFLLSFKLNTGTGDSLIIKACEDCYFLNEYDLKDVDRDSKLAFDNAKKTEEYYKRKIDQKLKELKWSYAWLYYNKLEGE